MEVVSAGGIVGIIVRCVGRCQSGACTSISLARAVGVEVAGESEMEMEMGVTCRRGASSCQITGSGNLERDFASGFTRDFKSITLQQYHTSSPRINMSEWLNECLSQRLQDAPAVKTIPSKAYNMDPSLPT
jgi:hypothetical protein